MPTDTHIHHHHLYFLSPFPLTLGYGRDVARRHPILSLELLSSNPSFLKCFMAVLSHLFFGLPLLTFPPAFIFSQYMSTNFQFDLFKKKSGLEQTTGGPPLGQLENTYLHCYFGRYIACWQEAVWLPRACVGNSEYNTGTDGSIAQCLSHSGSWYLSDYFSL